MGKEVKIMIIKHLDKVPEIHDSTFIVPNEHEKIWAIQKELDFPKTVYGVNRKSNGESNMPEVIQMLAKYMGAHKNDEIIES
jgi:hypothetical protein